MGVELPALGHLATTQNRMAPPSPDGTKSCAKLSFLSVPSPRSGIALLLSSTSKTLLQKAGPGTTAEMAPYRAREFVDRDRGPAGSVNLKPIMSISLAHAGKKKPLGFLSGTQSEHGSSSEEHTVIREPWDMTSAPATAIISVLGSSLTSPSWRDESLCLNGFLERVGIF